MDDLFTILNLDDNVLSLVLQFCAAPTLCSARLVCTTFAAISGVDVDSFWLNYAPNLLDGQLVKSVQYNSKPGGVNWHEIVCKRLIHLPFEWKLEGHFVPRNDIEIELTRNRLSRKSPATIDSDSTRTAFITTTPLKMHGAHCYYFEITVIKAGDAVGVGFASDNQLASNQPGWDSSSVGWHSDDGVVFGVYGSQLPNVESAWSESSKFGVGDTVGVGLLLSSNTSFATKNGKLMGYPWLPPCMVMLKKQSTHPCICLKGDAMVETNLNGVESSWKFDLENFVKLPLPPCSLKPRNRTYHF